MECRKTATNLDRILYEKDQTENNYTKIFKKKAGFISHLCIFEEMGIILIHKQIGYKSKMSDKGKEAFLLDTQQSKQVTYIACTILVLRALKSAVT